MRRRGARRAGRAAGRRAARRTTRRVVRRRRRWRRRIILAGGLIALGAYKLSKQDVQRVEEHTGKQAEELSDEELEQAMDELNIDAEPMSDQEMDSVEAQDAADEGSYLDELERLSEMKEKGIVTEEEFEAKKKQLLGL